MLVFFSFAMRQNEVIYEFEQRQQDLQVNYACDAATWMMLNETPDIGIDYTNISEIRVSPQIALDTYEAVMVRGLGWSDDRLTKDYFEATYVPFFIVAAYDGYYIYGVEKDTETVTRLDGTPITNVTYPKKWSPKIPYAEASMYGSKACINMYTLGQTTYTRYLYDTDSYDHLCYYKDSPKADSTATLNASMIDMKVFVSSALTDACQKCLLAAKSNVGTDQIIIPSSFSQWSSNRPIEYPTVLTYMDVAGDTTKYNHMSFAIGGSRIEEGDYYITYIDEKGAKAYTRAANRKDVETNRHLTIINVYTSPVDAAEKGYFYDLRYIK